MNFITSKTKVTSIVVSAMTLVALITMIMLSALIGFTPKSRIVMCLIYSLTLMLVTLIAKGIIDIFVFKDYKCQPKSICTEGVLNICMGILLAVTGILFATLQGNLIVNSIPLSTVDIRYFLASFTFTMSIWKLTEMLFAIKNKHFDRFIDIISFALWVLISLFILISIFIPSEVLHTFAWVIISMSWGIIVINIFNILFSYVIKTPDYLETEVAREIKELELQEQKLKKIQEKKELRGKSLKANLQQLKQLYESNLITQADYNARKKQLLENTFGSDENE